jgi:hypothetical protein
MVCKNPAELILHTPFYLICTVLAEIPTPSIAAICEGSHAAWLAVQ